MASPLVLKNHSDTSAEARVVRGSDGKPYPHSCCSWKVTYLKKVPYFKEKYPKLHISSFIIASRNLLPIAYLKYFLTQFKSAYYQGLHNSSVDSSQGFAVHATYFLEQLLNIAWLQKTLLWMEGTTLRSFEA